MGMNELSPKFCVADLLFSPEVVSLFIKTAQDFTSISYKTVSYKLILSVSKFVWRMAAAHFRFFTEYGVFNMKNKNK